MSSAPRGYRGNRGNRGSRGNRGKGGFQSRSNFIPSAKLQEGLLDGEIESISVATIRSNATDKVEATNVTSLGSYNWVDHSIPTIVIPGAPPSWTEPNLPLQLEPDVGDSFIDQNTARLPMHPLEPMFRAIDVTQKQLGSNFKLANESIDIVTDRNSLRKLTRFISSHGPNRDPRPGSNREFRIDVQLASNGRTLVLNRHEEDSVRKSTGFNGYGHNFEKATTEEIPPLLATNSTRTHISRFKSTGHHRITRYDLLGLRFLVRYEVDAMESAPPAEHKTVVRKDDVDDLAAALAQTSLLESTTLPKPRLVTKKPEPIIDVPHSELRHVIHGNLISQSQVLELRTIKSSLQVPWSDVYPQLFLSQTPVFKVAKQLEGHVDAIQTYTDGSDGMKEAHEKLAPDFVALVELLKQIRNIAKKQGLVGHNRPFSLYWSGTGDLKVRAVRSYDHLKGLLTAEELESF
ncbi:geranylgeranyl pyrophosphate synthetase, putative [Rhizoctonia solani AG-3 Rhs1AP]|uniref:Geranylgeranyl pyrophosphate synthetase, putative n=1 Tax=Rhizoctonia solani AG-3 Rhs1AP TaxID=1086054 RepID=X8JDD6_9AGAM|nr:geranylgeranyl pyrophosphate synthetase, putative [Rhizoctonia solani AG-3 Rhs1AP]